MLFRQIVSYALLIGVLSGIVVTAVQMWRVIPIIQSAEQFEHASAAAHSHDHAISGHGQTPWAPAPGLERTGYTLLSNVLIAAGLALVMLPLMVARGATQTAGSIWRRGLLWGLAGYTVFYLAPASGLPPEIPGAGAAPLEARQIWWLLSVACTASGLAWMVFGRSRWRWSSVALLLVPHLIGAPQPSVAPFSEQAPAVAAQLTQLAEQFITATAMANAALWLVLGLSSVWAVRRMLLSRH